ncbi:hypothetical protein QCA50_013495 [Cerrena zonata]|uniref:Uncharacterized protein n=1 Tax=Cerrena zonata TaxID=2478898 RepID=A0AAW0FQ97_9APHY
MPRVELRLSRLQLSRSRLLCIDFRSSTQTLPRPAPIRRTYYEIRLQSEARVSHLRLHKRYSRTTLLGRSMLWLPTSSFRLTIDSVVSARGKSPFSRTTFLWRPMSPSEPILNRSAQGTVISLNSSTYSQSGYCLVGCHVLGNGISVEELVKGILPTP